MPSKQEVTEYSMFEKMEKEKKEKVQMVASVLAGDSLGLVAHQTLIALDTKYPNLVVKPSLMGDIAALLLGVWGGLTLDYPLNVLVASLGGYVSTDLWRYVMELFPTAPQVRVAAIATVPVPVTTAQVSKVAYVTQNSVVVKPSSLMNQGRYVVMA